MSQLRALDLFCGGGGASMGLAYAGYDVTGVDIEPQPEYPFTFIRDDFRNVQLDDYDLIWASPPCQAYSTLRHLTKHITYPDYIAELRALLIARGRDYVIENVHGAPLHDPIELCGTMFELDVYRHRLFESNVELSAPCHPRHRRWLQAGYYTVSGHSNGRRGRLVDWQYAMEIHWLTTRYSLSQSVPPAYSEFIGRQIQHPSRRRL